MKKLGEFELTLKKYNTEYRELRKIWSDQSHQLILAKHISSKRRVINVKVKIQSDQQLSNILKHLQKHLQVQSLSFINRFQGYTIRQIQGSKKNRFKFQLQLLYEFGQATLVQLIHTKNLSSSNKSNLQFLNNLSKQFLQMLVQLQELPQVDLTAIFLEHELITVNNIGTLTQELKLCYLPLTILKERKLGQLDFRQHFYSARQLRIINRQTKDKFQIPSRIQVQEVIIESERETDASSWNLDILQALGLSLLRFLYVFCQDIKISESQFDLYNMNEQFQVDFNWGLINFFLGQCQKRQQYSLVVRQIRYMIKQCQQEKYFKEYQSDILNICRKTEKCSFLTSEKKLKQITFSGSANFFSPEAAIFPNKEISNATKLKEVEVLLLGKVIQQIQYEDGSRYKGETKAGQREGIGIYTFTQGDLFAGEWRQGFMEGKGLYLFINGQRYEGQIKGGLKHGYGTYYYHNGDRYAGMWVNDVKEGNGQFYCSITKQIFKGDFKNNFKQGKGSIFYPNNERFEGSFVQGMRHGEGFILDSTGKLTVKGKWQNDVLSGVVELFMSNNDYYIGEMKGNLKHGKGIYKYSDGTVYEGGFVDNMQTGQCTIHYANGDIYEGLIEDGKFQSKGKYTYKSYDLAFDGNWNKGLENGQGTFVYKRNIQISAALKNRSILSYNVEERLQDKSENESFSFFTHH